MAKEYSSYGAQFFQSAEVADVPPLVAAALENLAKARFPSTWRIAHNCMLAGYQLAILTTPAPIGAAQKESPSAPEP